MLMRSAFKAVALLGAFTTLVGCNSGGGQDDLAATPVLSTGTVRSSFLSLSPTVEISNTAFGTNSTVDMASGRMESNFGDVTYLAKSYLNGDAEASVTKYAAPNSLPSPNALVSLTPAIATVPTTGSATMTGRVEVASAQWVGLDADEVSQYSVTKQAGDITLVADFAASTLTGASSLLSVDGTFSGRNLAGTVTHDGVGGDLRGRIATVNSTNRHEALGYFHGSNSERGKAFSGAFVVVGDTLP